jgi:hypothetical protein
MKIVASSQLSVANKMRRSGLAPITMINIFIFCCAAMA